jgi:hypothetical protein
VRFIFAASESGILSAIYFVASSKSLPLSVRYKNPFFQGQNFTFEIVVKQNR